MENIYLWDKDIPYYNSEFENEHNFNAPSITPFIIDDGKKHPCLLVCPGGGYTHRADHEGEGTAVWLNKHGINAFVLNYRVAPYKHPVPLTDAKRAMRYIKYNADKFNIDSDKVGIIGFSAGAHIAACVSEYFDEFDSKLNDEIDEVDAKPDVCVLCYPVISLSEYYAHKGSAMYLTGDDKALAEKLSCEKNVREDMPPVFIWHTFEDASVPVLNSIRMAEALSEKNIDTELHLFQNGRHGSSIVKARDIKGTNIWPELLKKWLIRKGYCI